MKVNFLFPCDCFSSTELTSKKRFESSICNQQTYQQHLIDTVHFVTDTVSPYRIVSRNVHSIFSISNFLFSSSLSNISLTAALTSVNISNFFSYPK